MSIPKNCLQHAFAMQNDFVDKLREGNDLFYDLTGYCRPLLNHERCALRPDVIWACAKRYLESRKDYETDDQMCDASFLVNRWNIDVKYRLCTQLEDFLECIQIVMKNDVEAAQRAKFEN